MSIRLYWSAQSHCSTCLLDQTSTRDCTAVDPAVFSQSGAQRLSCWAWIPPGRNAVRDCLFQRSGVNRAGGMRQGRHILRRRRVEWMQHRLGPRKAFGFLAASSSNLHISSRSVTALHWSTTVMHDCWAQGDMYIALTCSTTGHTTPED